MTHNKYLTFLFFEDNDPISAKSAVQYCAKNHIFFFQMFLKDDLSKKLALEYDLSCIIRKDDISFPQKYNFIL